MGFDPNKPYKANRTDYFNIILCIALAVIAIIWALN
mgnify:CR=1 FL=1|jgi:hypothetical protein